MKSGYNSTNCVNGIQHLEKDLFMYDIITPEERLNFDHPKQSKILDCLIIALIVCCISLLNSI